MFEDNRAEPISVAQLQDEGFEYAGMLDVDSGTILLGDPGYWLPCKRFQEPGSDEYHGTDYDSIEISDFVSVPFEEAPEMLREHRRKETYRMAELMSLGRPEFDAEKFIEMELEKPISYDRYRYVQPMQHEHGGEGKGIHILTPHGDGGYPVYVKRLHRGGQPGPAAEVRIFLDYQVDEEDIGDGWIPGQLEMDLDLPEKELSIQAQNDAVYRAFIAAAEDARS